MYELTSEVVWGLAAYGGILLILGVVIGGWLERRAMRYESFMEERRSDFLRR